MFHRSVLTTAVILIAAALLVGITPAAWIEQARASAARRLLELGREAPKQVAVRCGFANADTLRRVFVRHIGVTPAEYRKRYAND